MHHRQLQCRFLRFSGISFDTTK